MMARQSIVKWLDQMENVGLSHEGNYFVLSRNVVILSGRSAAIHISLVSKHCKILI